MSYGRLFGCPILWLWLLTKLKIFIFYINRWQVFYTKHKSLFEDKKHYRAHIAAIEPSKLLETYPKKYFCRLQKIFDNCVYYRKKLGKSCRVFYIKRNSQKFFATAEIVFQLWFTLKLKKLCSKIFASTVRISSIVFGRKEVMIMLFSFLLSVAAGVVTHYVCKWLDRH